MREGTNHDSDDFTDQTVTENSHRSHISIDGELLQSTDSIAFHEEDEVYRLAYDREVDTTSLAIIAAVAAIADTDPVDLDPLYSTIDPEAVDTLFDGSATGQIRSTVRVSFHFNEFEITVTDREIIEVQPR